MYAKIKLRDRSLPDYTRAEEIVNMITHIAGGILGIVVLIACILRAAGQGNAYGITTSAIYGAAMIHSKMNNPQPSCGKTGRIPESTTTV